MTPGPECSLVQERLTALLTNDLPEGEAQLVRGHLKSCPDCSEERTASAALLADIRAAAPEPGEFDRARSRLVAALGSETRPPRSFSRILAPAAALALCTLAYFVLEPPRASITQLRSVSQAVTSQIESTLPRTGIADLDLDALDMMTGEER